MARPHWPHALTTLPQNTRAHLSPLPPQSRRGAGAFAHPGESPRVTRLCGEPVTLRLVPTLPPTRSQLGTAVEAAPGAPADPHPATHAGAHVRTRARTHTAPARPVPQLPDVRSREPVARRLARETARERAAGCVSWRRCVPCAAGSPPLPPGGVGPLPLRRLGKRHGPSFPPRATRGSCSGTGRRIDASNWGRGAFLVSEAQEENGNRD